MARLDFRFAQRMRLLAVKAFLPALLCMLAAPKVAFAWGDEGHEVVALIAQHYLSDAASQKIKAILASDSQAFDMRDAKRPDGSAMRTSDSFATQATWADYYRESTGRQGPAYQQTHFWHFADIEVPDGSLDEACFNYPALQPNQPASEGAPEDCVVDKIQEFAHELLSPETSDAERLLALKFVLHFVGDVHQPLHASDERDAGGNAKNVIAPKIKAGKLHHYWDTEFVLQLGATPENIAGSLIAQITPSQIQQWSSADPKQWANESYAVAKRFAYGALPEPVKAKTGGGLSYHLSDDYVSNATQVVGIQLSKAGVRLAATLNAVFQ